MKHPSDEEVSHYARQMYEHEMYGIFGPKWEMRAPGDFKEHVLLECMEKARFNFAKKTLWIQLGWPIRAALKWLSKMLDRNHCKD